jgi:hypothetical protein
MPLEREGCPRDFSKKNFYKNIKILLDILWGMMYNSYSNSRR